MKGAGSLIQEGENACGYLQAALQQRMKSWEVNQRSLRAHLKTVS